MNDGIPPDLCSLQYASVDDAVRVIQRLGRGTQLIKLDIQDAYRIVPVHPSDYSNYPQGPLVLSTSLKTLYQLGIPVATHKTEQPTSVLIFLGILIDTDRFKLRLPTEHLTIIYVEILVSEQIFYGGARL